MAKKKKFRMIDAILTVICVVFVAKRPRLPPPSATPSSPGGSSSSCVLMPYGLIVCELGTTYADDEGGIADWVRRASATSGAAA